jgi:hypothetical protein
MRRKGEDTFAMKRRRMPYVAKIKRDDPFRSADSLAPALETPTAPRDPTHSLRPESLSLHNEEATYQYQRINAGCPAEQFKAETTSDPTGGHRSFGQAARPRRGFTRVEDAGR